MMERRVAETGGTLEIDSAPGRGTRITARLHVANTSSGKRVTVIDGLPKNPAFLEALAKELKKSCGTGGKVTEGILELQGDQRERLHELLSRKGWTVEG